MYIEIAALSTIFFFEFFTECCFYEIFYPDAGINYDSGIIAANLFSSSNFKLLQIFISLSFSMHPKEVIGFFIFLFSLVSKYFYSLIIGDSFFLFGSDFCHKFH